MLKAILAPSVLAKDYAIDPERVFISGFSGGGVTATRVATSKPDIFKGAIFISGTVYWAENVPTGFQQIKNNRYYFLTGSSDGALDTTKRVYKSYRKAGVEFSELRILQNWPHRLPDAAIFEGAIEYIDRPGNQ